MNLGRVINQARQFKRKPRPRDEFKAMIEDKKQDNESLMESIKNEEELEKTYVDIEEIHADKYWKFARKTDELRLLKIQKQIKHKKQKGESLAAELGYFKTENQETVKNGYISIFENMVPAMDEITIAPLKLNDFYKVNIERKPCIKELSKTPKEILNKKGVLYGYKQDNLILVIKQTKLNVNKTIESIPGSRKAGRNCYLRTCNCPKEIAAIKKKIRKVKEARDIHSNEASKAEKNIMLAMRNKTKHEKKIKKNKTSIKTLKDILSQFYTHRIRG